MTRLATKLYAASLYLYPTSFRDEYGPEMRRLLADSLREIVRDLIPEKSVD